MADNDLGWKWTHKSPDNTFGIKFFDSKSPRSVVASVTIVYVAAKKKVIIWDDVTKVPFKQFESQYQPMSRFPKEEMPLMIKAVFNT